MLKRDRQTDRDRQGQTDRHTNRLTDRQKEPIRYYPLYYHHQQLLFFSFSSSFLFYCAVVVVFNIYCTQCVFGRAAALFAIVLVLGRPATYRMLRLFPFLFTGNGCVNSHIKKVLENKSQNRHRSVYELTIISVCTSYMAVVVVVIR